MADKYTLSVPPSEHFRIVATVPPMRPGRESRAGELNARSQALDEHEDVPYNGTKSE
jgi:hypothetical protein